jgi:hypothetical protein
MPHFELDLDQDGSARAIYKDGELIEGAISLESPNSIVQTYFASAIRNIDAMTVGDDPDGDRARDNRHFGLQSFLMSLVGTEAFLNIYFHQLGNLQGLPDVIDLATSDKPIEHKLSHLPRRAFGSPLPNSKKLCAKMRELYDLRSNMVHPKWTPSSIAFDGMMYAGFVDNQQKLFENREFCRETLRWCLLVIARIGVHSGSTRWDFVYNWSMIHETNESLSNYLGIPADGI